MLLATSATVDLFNVDGSLVLLDAGTFVSVGGKVLLEIIRKHIAIKRLVNRDGRWEVEFAPVTIDERLLRIILTGKDMRTGDELKGGPLASRVPKA